MRAIALTGTDIHAQSNVLELLLERTRRARVKVVIFASCQDLIEIEFIRQQCALFALWLIGDEAAFAFDSPLIDVRITDEDIRHHSQMTAAVERELQTFFFKAASLGGTAPSPTPTEPGRKATPDNMPAASGQEQCA